VRTIALALLLLPACRFLEGRLPTEKPPLYDMEEPLALHEEPDDETERAALPAGCFTGIYVTDARESLEEMESEPEGLLVHRVVENSPAAAAGLVEGDLLLEADGKPLHWESEWREVELETQPGAEVHLVYDRAGAERDATLTVTARVVPAARQDTERFREEDRVGLVFRTATEVEARGAGLGPGGGAVVVGLARTSPWRQAGLQFEDLIVRADGIPIAHPNVLLATIRAAPAKGSVKLDVLRGSQHLEIDAPVSRRAKETKRVSVPLLFTYEKDRGRKSTKVLFGLYKHVRTPAAWELRLFWIFKWRGGDADRLEEVKQ